MWHAAAAVPDDQWQPIVMGKGRLTAQITALDYTPQGWPDATYTIARRVWTPADQISDSDKARRKRTFGPEQLAADLGASVMGRWAYSFIVTNIPTGGDGFHTLTQVEAWFRGRADIENVILDSKHGAGLTHLPSASHTVNTVWMWAAFIATSLTVMIQTLAGTHGPRARTLTMARNQIQAPARIIHHAGIPVIRPGPAAATLPDLLSLLGVRRV